MGNAFPNSMKSVHKLTLTEIINLTFGFEFMQSRQEPRNYYKIIANVVVDVVVVVL